MTWIFWLYTVGAVGWSLWSLAYGVLSPWYRSAQGWTLFVSWMALALTLDLAALFRLVVFPHPAAVALAAVVLSMVAVAGWVQLVSGLYLQLRRDRPEPRRRPTDR